MSNPSIDHLADRKRPPGYGLLKVTQRTVEETLDGRHGSGLAMLYAEEIVNLQEKLKFVVDRIRRLEELVNLPLDRFEKVEKATCPSS